MSTTATLRFDDEEKLLLQSFAESKGWTFTQFLKEAAFDYIEQEVGLKVYKEYLKENGTLKTYSHDEVKKELGLWVMKYDILIQH